MKAFYYKQKSIKWFWFSLFLLTVLDLWSIQKNESSNVPIFIILFIIFSKKRMDKYIPWTFKNYWLEAIGVSIIYFMIGILIYYVFRQVNGKNVYTLIYTIDTLITSTSFLYYIKIINSLDTKLSERATIINVSLAVIVALALKSFHPNISTQDIYPLESLYKHLAITVVILSIVTMYMKMITNVYSNDKETIDNQGLLIQQLTYQYSKNDKQRALDEISFKIDKGQILGIIGSHGSGKTTLIKCIARDLKTMNNIIHFDGKEIKRKNLGYVPTLFPFEHYHQINDIIDILKNTYDQWNQDEFDHYAARYDLDTEMKVKELSLGMQQRLMIAIALSHEADLIVMDEPTDGIDGFTREDILRDIQDYNYKYNATIIIATHQVEFYENILDKVVYLNNGNVELETDIITFTQDHGTIKEYILMHNKEV